MLVTRGWATCWLHEAGRHAGYTRLGNMLVTRGWATPGLFRACVASCGAKSIKCKQLSCMVVNTPYREWRDCWSEAIVLSAPFVASDASDALRARGWTVPGSAMPAQQTNRRHLGSQMRWRLVVRRITHPSFGVSLARSAPPEQYGKLLHIVVTCRSYHLC